MADSDTAPSADARSTIAEKIITEIARREDVSPLDLTPLHDSIDPDALDRLFDPTVESGRMVGAVSFQYCGYDVIVHADGYVEITARE